MLAIESSPMDVTMVGLVCGGSIVLATNSRNHTISHLDERIFCCAPKNTFHRERVLDVGGRVDSQARDRGQKMTVSHVRDLFYHNYDPTESLDMIVAGEDFLGLQIYNLGAHAGVITVKYAIRGKQGVENAYQYLWNHWQESMSIEQGEQLARKILQGDHNDFVEMCIIYGKESSQLY